MDTRQIEYIIKIAEERSITRAAERLFLTQSALSQQLLKLEKELGTRLFSRSRHEWLPTPEGEVYLENARKMLQLKKQSYTIIGDMVKNKHGFLSVGLTPGRGPDMFTHVYPLFHQEYPNVTVEPLELSVHAQQEKIHRGELDIGFMTLTENQKTGDEYLDLYREELLLAVPEGYPLPPEILSYPGDADEKPSEGIDAPNDLPTVPLSAFQYEPFVLMYRESTVRKTTDRIFNASGFQPTVLFETSSNYTVLSMISSRLCCGIIPYYYAKKRPKGISFYRLPLRPDWTVSVSYKRDSYLSEAAHAFIDLARRYWIDDYASPALQRIK